VANSMSLDIPIALDLYRRMALIRGFEERVSELYMRGKISGFLHLYIGEEAVASGVFSALAPQDYVVSHYRAHGHALARGVDPKRLMAELVGKETGTSQGKGGSMHIFDSSKGFLGGYAIVGGMLPIATGLALGAKLNGEDRVTVAIFGDGTLNQGELWESMNLASLWGLPVVFLLENNGYGMGTATKRACALQEVRRAPELYGIKTEVVDGMDALAVREAALRSVSHARSGKGPAFLEAVCYRFRGHSITDQLIYRERAEEEQWALRDPIPKLAKQLEDAGMRVEIDDIAQEVAKTVDEAAAFADASGWAPDRSMFDHVFAE
jgi:pyruvate dehydrogenase E1 component alpha subunit